MTPSLSSSAFVLLSGLILLSGSSRAQNATPGATAIGLPALVAEIEANNPELKFYEAEIAVAKAGRRSAAAPNDPELSLDLGRKRIRDAAGAIVGEGTSWSIAVTQRFEWPGRLDLRKAIANQEVTLAELGLDRFKRALSARARVLAYGLYAAQAKAAAVREVADRVAALKETFLARDPAGITPLLETRVLEAKELALQRRATEAELAVQSALIELNQLRGAALDAPLRVAVSGIRFNEAPANAALLSGAHENNFEFRMRRAELEQQGYIVRLAQNERYPAVEIAPFISRANAGDRETVVGLGLRVPLPLTARTRGAIEVAESRRQQAETALTVAQRALDRDVLMAAQAFAVTLAEARRWSSDSVTKFREAAELADQHYRLGAVPVATYVELQNSYLEAAEALLDTQRDTLEAGLKLQELTGLGLNTVEVAP